MPWKDVRALDRRREFVELASAGSVSFAELCRRSGISRKTGYQVMARYRAEGEAGLEPRSRRPTNTPRRTPAAMEERVLTLRERHPAWGGRKLRRRLLDQGVSDVPSPNTVTAILKRHGRIDPVEAAKHQAWQRYEHDAPNRLWQMDFKGPLALGQGSCSVLTVLDDHSRFLVGLIGCANQRGETVAEGLTRVFRRYGLPERMLMDNGSPWGADATHPYTPLVVWLLRLNVAVTHGRPYHPQTQGKAERFHRTLEAELLRDRLFADLGYFRASLAPWQDHYNLERPHQALDLATPASRYQPSPRSFPERLPEIEYGPDDTVRKVQAGGQISFRNRSIRLPKAFRGYPVALRPTLEDGVFNVFFAQQLIQTIDLLH